MISDTIKVILAVIIVMKISYIIVDFGAKYYYNEFADKCHRNGGEVYNFGDSQYICWDNKTRKEVNAS